MESAFSLDGLQNSHPIKVPVYHPDEINEIFDSISYNKVFLKTHKYGLSLFLSLLSRLCNVDLLLCSKATQLTFR